MRRESLARPQVVLALALAFDVFFFSLIAKVPVMTWEGTWEGVDVRRMVSAARDHEKK